jgi:hypothetical protein
MFKLLFPQSNSRASSPIPENLCRQVTKQTIQAASRKALRRTGKQTANFAGARAAKNAALSRQAGYLARFLDQATIDALERPCIILVKPVEYGNLFYRNFCRLLEHDPHHTFSARRRRQRAHIREVGQVFR